MVYYHILLGVLPVFIAPDTSAVVVNVIGKYVTRLIRCVTFALVKYESINHNQVTYK